MKHIFLFFLWKIEYSYRRILFDTWQCNNSSCRTVNYNHIHPFKLLQGKGLVWRVGFPSFLGGVNLISEDWCRSSGKINDITGQPLDWKTHCYVIFNIFFFLETFAFCCLVPIVLCMMLSDTDITGCLTIKARKLVSNYNYTKNISKFTTWS